MSGAVLVTGATGFVGRALLQKLALLTLPAGSDRPVIALVRTWTPDLPSTVIQRLTGPIEEVDEDHWMAALDGVEVIVHLAAIAHIGPDVPEDRYDAVNHRATTALAQAALRAGVKRFVFMSSIRAQTGASAPEPVSEDSPPAPTDAYGRAKLAAEADLRSIPIEHVILRPVVIIGPEPKGNLALLLKLAHSGLPLPVAAFKSRRSMVSLADVVETTIRSIDDPVFAGKTMILADPEPLSLGEMLSALRKGLGMSARQFRLPAWLLALPFRLAGRGDLWERIGGASVAKPEAAFRLGLRVTVSARQALEQLARQWQAQASRTARQSSE